MSHSWWSTFEGFFLQVHFPLERQSGTGGVTDPTNSLGGEGGGGPGGGFGTNGSKTVGTIGLVHIWLRNRSGFNHVMKFGQSRLLEVHLRSI